MDDDALRLAELRHERDSLSCTIAKMRRNPPHTLSPEEHAKRMAARAARLEELRGLIDAARPPANHRVDIDTDIPPSRRALSHKIHRYRQRLYGLRYRTWGLTPTDNQRRVISETSAALAHLEHERHRIYGDCREGPITRRPLTPADTPEETERRINYCRVFLYRYKRAKRHSAVARERLPLVRAALKKLVAHRADRGWTRRPGPQPKADALRSDRP